MDHQPLPTVNPALSGTRQGASGVHLLPTPYDRMIVVDAAGCSGDRYRAFRRTTAGVTAGQQRYVASFLRPLSEPDDPVK